MSYEVEQKFRVDDLDAIRARLEQFGATRGETCDQSDSYFRHPVRDFAATDEAFRLRRSGASGVLTYKGPKLDATTKTRVEHEALLADGAANLATADVMLQALGFAPVAVVAKRRETWSFPGPGGPIEVALDEVVGVGAFVELELAVTEPDARSAESPLDAARTNLAAAATALGLDPGRSERRSYLELLLASGSRS
ncbi:MAG: class IV adenylate cyclase [Pirellulales bacterium]|nr:class IV adenylate cyclase [Pirellulales bacterium]